MSAFGEREVVGKLIGVLQEAARRVAIRAEAFEATDEDSADEVARNKRQVFEAVGRRGGFVGRSAIEGVPNVVDEGAGEDARLADREKLLAIASAIRELGESFGIEERDLRVVVRVASKERIVPGEVVIHSYVIGVEIRRLIELPNVSGLLGIRTVNCRRRDQLQIRYDRRANRPALRQESPSPRSQTRYQLDQRQSQPLAETFIRAEEERFVFDDRPTARSAELIALERIFRRILRAHAREIISASVERAVAQELEDRSVKLIRARTSRNVEDAARSAAIFRAVGVRQDREFLHRLDAAHQALRARRIAPQRVEKIGAVEHIGVLRSARAMH